MNDAEQIRDYLRKMLERSEHADLESWANQAGVDPVAVSAFLQGDDISLSQLLSLCAAVDAFVAPIPEEKRDETVILLEEAGYYEIGTAPAPSQRYEGFGRCGG